MPHRINNINSVNVNININMPSRVKRVQFIDIDSSNPSPLHTEKLIHDYHYAYTRWNYDRSHHRVATPVTQLNCLDKIKFALYMSKLRRKNKKLCRNSQKVIV